MDRGSSRAAGFGRALLGLPGPDGRRPRLEVLATIAVAVIVVAVVMSLLVLRPGSAPSAQPSTSGVAAVSTPPAETPSPAIEASPSATAVPTPTSTPSPSPSPSPSPAPTPRTWPTPTMTTLDALMAAGVDEAGGIGTAAHTTGTWARIGTNLLMTTDSGRTWSTALAPAPTDSSGVWSPMIVMDTQHAWTLRAGSDSVVGTDNDIVSLLVLRTVDGGATWHSTQIPGNWAGKSERLLFADTLHGILLAGDFWGTSTVYKTSDGGVTWKATGTSTVRSTISMSDANTLWASSSGGGGMCMDCGQPILSVSRDSGKTWSSVQLPGVAAMSSQSLGSVQAPVFLDATHGYTAIHQTANDGTKPVTTVFASSDGGVTWAKTGGSFPYWAYRLTFVDAMHWRADVQQVGDKVIGPVTTDDGGLTWTAATAPAPSTGSMLNETWFAAPQQGGAIVLPLISGLPYQTLAFTSDGGRTWKPAWFGSWQKKTGDEDKTTALSLASGFSQEEISAHWSNVWLLLSPYSRSQYGSQAAFITAQSKYFKPLAAAFPNSTDSQLLTAADASTLGPVCADALASADVGRGWVATIGFQNGDTTVKSQVLIVAPFRGTNYWRVWIVSQS